MKGWIWLHVGKCNMISKNRVTWINEKVNDYENESI